MWVLYTVTKKSGKIKMLCYTLDYQSAVDAMEMYANSFYKQKFPEWEPTDEYKTPIEMDSDIETEGYHLLPSATDQEISLLKTDKKGEAKVLRTFHLDQVDKFIKDFLKEKTLTSLALEADWKPNIPLPPKPKTGYSSSSSSDDGESMDSDEYTSSD